MNMHNPPDSGVAKCALATADSDLSIVAIIPLYNGARWIEQSLKSVFDQTLPPDEIVIVDDGSMDDGAAIIERMRQDHPKITLLHKPNGGQSSARNYGVANSKSALIALLDQDDAWYPHHLERLIRPFRKAHGIPIGWVYSDLDHIDEGGGLIARGILRTHSSIHPKLTLRDCLSHDMFVLPSASLISRAAFNAVGGFDERLCGYEDDDLFVRLFRSGYANVFLREPLSQWRIYGGSASFTDRMSKSRMVYFNKLIAMFPDDPGRGLLWARECIVPRFINVVRGEYGRCLDTGDIAGAAVLATSIQDICAFLPRRPRVKIRFKLFGRSIRFNTRLSRDKASWILIHHARSELA